ncbi:antitoxin VbhA family protein [Curtobacterium sp. C1]|uniref:antitoxin VbhA family protein n=1 Tax=Curtobacterium sp. C1 TaxID=2898151 RepID=UPI001E6086EC|nr:antitoxin VbhA family protein [Curtobacterium sp. C1]UFU15595.1 antitoxin VbhA family protein [Curtobacterium sp. C1]
MGAASSGSGSSAKNITRSPHHDELETTSDDGRGAALSALGGGRTSYARCIFSRGAMNDDRRPLSGDALEQAMAMIEKGQQLAGHFPDAEALGRARGILDGSLTYEEAAAQLEAKYGFPVLRPRRPSRLSPDEHDRRRQIVDEARVSTALEGGRASDAVHELQDRWAAGETTWEQMQAEVRRLHPSTADPPET